MDFEASAAHGATLGQRQASKLPQMSVTDLSAMNILRLNDEDGC